MILGQQTISLEILRISGHSPCSVLMNHLLIDGAVINKNDTFNQNYKFESYKRGRVSFSEQF